MGAVTAGGFAAARLRLRAAARRRRASRPTGGRRLPARSRRRLRRGRWCAAPCRRRRVRRRATRRRPSGRALPPARRTVPFVRRRAAASAARGGRGGRGARRGAAGRGLLDRALGGGPGARARLVVSAAHRRRHAGARAGHEQRREARRGLAPAGAHRVRHGGQVGEPLAYAGQREQAGELARHAPGHGQRDLDAALDGEPAARLAVRDVAREPALVAHAQADLAGIGDDPLDAQAAGAGRELVVLLAQPLARAEQRALDRRAAHAHALADVLVAQALELAHHEDLVMGVGQPAEGAAEQVELLLGVDRLVWARRRLRQPAVVGGGEPVVGVERDLLGAPPAAVGVDARVLGDLVDPGLEGDGALGLAHPPQRGRRRPPG